MIISTQAGEQYRERYSTEIESAIQEVKQRRHDAYLDNDRTLAIEDFCVFVRENGYMVMIKEAYQKLSKTKKKFIERSYEYRQIAG